MELKRKSTAITDGSSLPDHSKRSKVENPAGETFQPDSFVKAFVSDDVMLIPKELYSLKKVTILVLFFLDFDSSFVLEPFISTLSLHLFNFSYTHLPIFVSDHAIHSLRTLFSVFQYLTSKDRVLTLLNKNKDCFHVLIQCLMTMFNEIIQRDKGSLHTRFFLSFLNYFIMYF